MSEIVTVIVERPINVTHISRGQAATVSTQRVVQTNVVPQPVIVQNDTTISVTNTVPTKTTIGLPGLQGPEGERGPPGAGANTFIFYQNIAATTWLIVHNLGQFPSVTVVDSAGELAVGAVTYIDDNTIELDFSAPFSGTAYLN